MQRTRQIVCALVLIACAACSSVPQATSDATAAQTSPAPRVVPTAAPRLTIGIACPAPVSGAWTSYTASFNPSLYGPGPITQYGIDYGDGHGYVTADRATAEREEYWHKYTTPGSFTVHAWAINGANERSDASCVFTWSSTLGPQGGGGRYRVGAICRDGWESSATGSGACSHHGGVSEWLYGP